MFYFHLRYFFEKNDLSYKIKITCHKHLGLIELSSMLRLRENHTHKRRTLITLFRMGFSGTGAFFQPTFCQNLTMHYILSPNPTLSIVNTLI